MLSFSKRPRIDADSEEKRIELAAQKIIDQRKNVMSTNTRQHTCSKKYCDPVSELTLIETGLLPRSSAIFHPAVYVCVFRQLHVCTPDRCMEFVGTADGVCPVTGIYHGHTEGEKAWVMPEKRTAHFKRNGVKGLSGNVATELSKNASREQQLHYERTIAHLDGHSDDNNNNNNVFGILSSSLPPNNNSLEIKESSVIHQHQQKQQQQQQHNNLFLLRCKRRRSPKNPEI